MRLLALAFLLIAACSRPMTENEERFARDLFGDGLDTSKVTVSHNLGLTPPPKTVPSSVRRLRGTERACVRTPQPVRSEPPQAFALFSRMHFGNDLYSTDMVAPWPNGLRLPQALIFAHELTHVWQWQNRDRTGYTPLRAIGESLRLADPYFFQPQDAPAFFAFGYEQQAAIVEDFICFTVANPTHPMREELRALLLPVFPVEAFEASIVR